MRTKNLLARTTSLGSLSALLLVTPLLGGARGCGGDDVPIGAHDAGPAAECTVTECGPALGAPAILCEDGSIGGNTGLCVRDATTGLCGWQVRDCPTTVSCGGLRADPTTGICPPGFYCAYSRDAICGAADAGGTCQAIPDACPGIGALVTVCGCDGVTYETECLAAAAGTSVMRNGDCDTPPPGECAPGECGPALGVPAILCEDGSIGGNTGRCLRDPATSTCGWELRECPAPGGCTDAECGPAPLSPAIRCADGSTGGNLGLCSRDPATGICGWQFRDCPTTTSCGGLVAPGTSPGCDPGFYCAYSLDATCGAADATGVCTLVPDACSLEYGPVCGCDGVTYDNDCFAAGSGTSVLHVGPCAAPPPVRLCLADADCASAGAIGSCDTSVCYTAPCPPGMACPALCYGICADPTTPPSL